MDSDVTCQPISLATVNRILALISPLVEPLPQNLISKLLLRRHHFLGLSPDNVAEYLAWVSADQSHVLHLLEEQTLPNVVHHLSVQYMADSEDILAHVRITPDLRLVFLWEAENGWQYHNLAVMPFPPNSYADFDEAYMLYSQKDFLTEQNCEAKAHNDDDDDSYWNAYGHENNNSDHTSFSKVPEDSTSEDAYWARYSLVQGSADSTIPSPARVKNLSPEVSSNKADPFPERIIVPPTEFQIHHVEPYNPLEPPSSAELSRRLEALSPSSPFVDPVSDTTSQNEEIRSFHPTSSHISPNPMQEPLVGNTNSMTSVEDPLQDTLTDAIKNLYKLWRSGRQDKSADHDKEIFIHSVQQALGGL